jgi:hypothetical protein
MTSKIRWVVGTGGVAVTEGVVVTEGGAGRAAAEEKRAIPLSNAKEPNIM